MCQRNNAILTHDRCHADNSNYFWKFRNGTTQIAFLLHSLSKSNFIFSNADSGKDYTLQPGKMVSSNKQDLTGSCDGSECPSSFWQTSYDQIKSYYISDVSRIELDGSKILLKESYSIFLILE
jgi:hypothetical protein